MMEKEPVLEICRKIERPRAALLAPFQDVPTCFIADALAGRGALHYSVKPLVPEMRLCGPAVTVSCSAADNLAAMAVLDFVSPGDVIMIACGGNFEAAIFGDLWAMSAKRLGVAGIVCDGLVRDVSGILAAGIPVFARGWCPNAGQRTGPGTINLEVHCGGVPVEPGDVIVGDRDGVVVVRMADMPKVLDQLALVRQKEDQAQTRLSRGETLRFWDQEAFAGQGLLTYRDEERSSQRDGGS